MSVQRTEDASEEEPHKERRTERVFGKPFGGLLVAFAEKALGLAPSDASHSARVHQTMELKQEGRERTP